MKRAIRSAGIAYLLVLIGLWLAVYIDGGRSLVITLFLFGPRWVIATPLLILLPATLVADRKFVWLYLLHAGILLVPLLGFHYPLIPANRPEGSPTLRVMTCNLGGGEVQTTRLADFIKTDAIDVVALQECPSSISNPLFKMLGWKFQQVENLAIGSRYPLGDVTVLARQPKSTYTACAAIGCLISVATDTAHRDVTSPESETTQIRVVCVHFPTFRDVFEGALKFDPSIESTFQELSVRYADVAQSVLEHTNTYQEPKIIAGDFNVPVESEFYHHFWNSFQNCLSEQGKGMNPTKHTKYHGVRIDHILADYRLRTENAYVHSDFGGDHRPVIATLWLVAGSR
jgi:endonuclease/exonuclease/phosphatase family metal-dependent hydrolase